MTLEIRPYREEETEQFFRVPAIVFGNYTGQPRDPAHGVDMPLQWTLCAFEDGELATAYGAFPMGMRLNGAKVSVAGVSFVGTLPQFRRRGHLRKIMEADFQRRYEERMEPLAILTASMAAIYQRYGYAVVTNAVRYAIDPRYINFAPSVPKPEGAWREGSKDELPLLQDMYREFTAPRTGYLHRGGILWDTQTFGIGGQPGGAPDFGPSIISIYEEHGEPKGYVAWAAKWFTSFLDGAGIGQRLWVRDFAWLTPGAYRAMWELFRTFDLVTRVIIDNAPIDDPAPQLLLDPRELNATHRDWLMGRIIDVERTLALRPYGAEGHIVFELRDEMCRWNAGRWALDAAPEGAKISRTTETAQLTLDVSALVLLLFGQISVTNAVRYGRAEASPGAPIALWDAIWRTAYAPACSNMF
ncbi:MAG: GNAT family N-acetyltransferase [Chloroflexota bacterium]|nr:GNAT family N-acetyltransferase [Chloroflexota bacterium]